MWSSANKASPASGHCSYLVMGGSWTPSTSQTLWGKCTIDRHRLACSSPPQQMIRGPAPPSPSLPPAKRALLSPCHHQRAQPGLCCQPRWPSPALGSSCRAMLGHPSGDRAQKTQTLWGIELLSCAKCARTVILGRRVTRANLGWFAKE